MNTQPAPFPCVVCGGPAIIRQMRIVGEYTRRTRICTAGHGFRTYQNGGGEILDCYVVSGVHAGTMEYRAMRRTYDRLKVICEFYGDWRILAALERARQKAGLRR